MEQLTEYDKARYNRQMMIGGWGEEGQRKLKESSVFMVGAGGLGSPISIYLAVAGVGELRICDSDRIELSNLNRQILHTDMRVGQLKAGSAEETLRQLNPTIKVVTYSERIERHNADQMVGNPDVIVDGLDNFDTRYLLNDQSIKKNIPLVHGAIWGLTGQVTVVQPPETPCLKCLFAEAPPRELFPVVGVTPGLTGCIQAMEVLKLLTGVGTPLKGKLLYFDGQDMTFRMLKVGKAPNCPACGRLT